MTENDFIFNQANANGQLIEILLKGIPNGFVAFDENGKWKIFPTVPFNIHLLDPYSSPLEDQDEFAVWDFSNTEMRKITWAQLKLEILDLIEDGPGFRAFKSDQVAVPPETSTKIIFDTQVFDTKDNYDPVTGRFTAPFPGVFRFRAQLIYEGLNIPNVAQLTLVKNGTTDMAVQIGGILNSNAQNTTIEVEGTFELDALDYIEVFTEHLANVDQTAGDGLGGVTCVFEGNIITSVVMPPVGYAFIQKDGEPVDPPRHTFNVFHPIQAVDDNVNNRTDIKMHEPFVAGGVAGAYDQIQYDKFGRITGVVPGAPPAIGGCSFIAVSGSVPNLQIAPAGSSSFFRNFTITHQSPANVFISNPNGDYFLAPFTGVYLLNAEADDSSNNDQRYQIELVSSNGISYGPRGQEANSNTKFAGAIGILVVLLAAGQTCQVRIVNRTGQPIQQSVITMRQFSGALLHQL
ncbi:MAG: hypothetical protein K1X66_02405 [Verrucomicrobiae bacterium]|nr:hypothetical protein [Verrucomicrobiae bacterium]